MSKIFIFSVVILAVLTACTSGATQTNNNQTQSFCINDIKD